MSKSLLVAVMDREIIFLEQITLSIPGFLNRALILQVRCVR